MKKLILLWIIGLSMVCYSQEAILTLTTPAASNDTMACFAGYLPSLVFADYSDLDGDVYISVGPTPGDNKPSFYSFGAADSVLLDYSEPRMIDGTAVRRTAFQVEYNWTKTCFRIWNVSASADSTLYIYKYKYIP